MQSRTLIIPFEEGKGYGRKRGPKINGIKPVSRERQHRFNNCYMGLNYPLEYTGGLLLAYGFIREFYVHMGFQKPWTYERVLELIFEEGMLSRELDLSGRMAEVRQLIREALRKKGSNDEEPRYEEMIEFVVRSFDRTY